MAVGDADGIPGRSRALLQVAGEAVPAVGQRAEGGLDAPAQEQRLISSGARLAGCGLWTPTATPGRALGRLRRPSLVWTAWERKGYSYSSDATSFCSACGLVQCWKDPVGRALMSGLQTRPQPLAMVGVRLRVRGHSPGRAQSARDKAASPELPRSQPLPITRNLASRRISRVRARFCLCARTGTQFMPPR